MSEHEKKDGAGNRGGLILSLQKLSGHIRSPSEDRWTLILGN